MTSKVPTLNVSGYRGIWGETLTKEIVAAYTHAFVRMLQQEIGTEALVIMIARDGRLSGPRISEVLEEVLHSYGVTVINADVLPTPTVLFSVRTHGYSGGVIITASHNPVEYNGLKFVNHEGLFLNPDQVALMNTLFNEAPPHTLATSPKILPQEILPNFAQEHVQAICNHIAVDRIRAQKFHILVDVINASASVMYPYFFEALGVTGVVIHSDPLGVFAHRPEPIADNLETVAQEMRSGKYDIGCVHDPDADRLVIFDETGAYVFEEYTLALCIEHILSKHPQKNVVVNLSTSACAEYSAKKYAGTCYRTKIGEGNVVLGMKHHHAIIGGEGNGGVIYPTINTARDSFVGIALILELLAERDMTVSEIVRSLPRLVMKKESWPRTHDIDVLYDRLKKRYHDIPCSTEDGLRYTFPDGAWMHIRPSNTEPIVRLIGEASDDSRIHALFEEVRTILEISS
jgi:phosphomannomutase